VQRTALDRFAGSDALDALATLRAAREEGRALRMELDALGGDDRARAREADLLRFQVEEIDLAAITDPAEDDALRAEEAMLADATTIREVLAAAYHAVEDDGVDALGAAAASLAESDALADLQTRVKGLQAELDELGRDLRVAADGVVDDPARLEAVRERRRLLQQLRRKYGETLADVLAYRAEVGERLAQLEHHDEYAARLQAEIVATDARATTAAETLHRARVAAAGPMAVAVTAHLRELAMPRAEVTIAVEPGDLTDDGADAVTFLLAANAGESARPLARAASGGELARAMLALRLVCSDAPPTLVFDEVDAGIGGEAGTAVGRLLGVLGRTHQVLCVTHLAQVAAFADHQVAVEKVEQRAQGGRRTVARATGVEGDARVRELSRMLAGVEESDHARRHAAELLASAHATATTTAGTS
jgi:DNA repair protein RecN (Recombination protein N)